MTKTKTQDYYILKTLELLTACLLIGVLVGLNRTPTNGPKIQIVKVPVERVVEKPVIVKVPIRLSSHDEQQIQCLTRNAYFEAGNQSKKGMIAVTNVVMNRVKDRRFPKTPCSVINQKRGGVCQFSWVCEGNKAIHSASLFTRSKRVAEQVYLNNIKDVTRGAKFYHANYVSPGWSRQFKTTVQIGAHIFYRG